MSEELEGTETEVTSQDEAAEFDTAVENAEIEPLQDAEAEAEAEAEEVVEEDAEDAEDDKIVAAFGIKPSGEEEMLQAKAAEAFGLGIAPAAEEEDEDEDAEVEAEEEAVEEEALEEYAIPDDGREWFVVHCYSGYENKVRHSIEQRIETMGMQDMIFDVVVPTEEEIEIKDGKRRTVERRVFPGYILVQMLMSEESWYVVRNTPGVTGFVGMGNEPTPLRPDEVAKIMNRMEAEAPKVKFDFQIGEKVRIGTGPFADFIGTVAEIDADRAKVRVMVSFFGRETPVELDFLHVEKV